MAFWLEHPTYANTRDRLIRDLTSGGYRFRKLAPVLFLCGGMNSPRRGWLRQYLEHKYGRSLQIFYAEAVWDEIAAHAQSNALAMEAELAALADLLIIIVESPGTCAELGAFSLSADLRRKLLPIVDREYKDSGSFIVTGPLRWIDAESKFGPTVYAPLKQILEVADQIESRIGRIDKPRPERLEDLAQRPKHLLFFISDLVAVIYPATIEVLEYYLTRIVPAVPTSKIAMLVGLGVAMQLLKRCSIDVDGQAVSFFVPSGASPLASPYHHRRLLDLPSRRADHVAALLAIPLAREILASLQAPQ